MSLSPLRIEKFPIANVVGIGECTHLPPSGIIPYTRFKISLKSIDNPINKNLWFVVRLLYRNNNRYVITNAVDFYDAYDAPDGGSYEISSTQGWITSHEVSLIKAAITKWSNEAIK